MNLVIVVARGDHFQFGSVFIKKNNRNRPVSVRFGFLGQKPVPTGFGSVFPVWLGFSSLGSVRFFQFQAYKTEPNESVFSKF